MKCEQYWPELGDTATFGLIDVTTVEESVQVSAVHLTLKYSAVQYRIIQYSSTLQYSEVQVSRHSAVLLGGSGPLAQLGTNYPGQLQRGYNDYNVERK